MDSDQWLFDYTRGEARRMAEINSHSEREQAHLLLDALSEEKVAAVRGLLEVMVEPLSRSLASASAEEEELTGEVREALNRSRASLARGEAVAHEDVLREFGL
jgi:ethanolamine utilization microcompartment shell protein EutL